MLCARCGRPLVRGMHVGAFCLECFLEVNRLLCVPERLVFDYCKYCGSVRIGHRWVEGGELPAALQRFVETYFSDSTRVRPCRGSGDTVTRYWFKEAVPLTAPSWRTMYRVVFGVQLQGVDSPVEQEYRVEVRASPSICPLCKDARGGDYNVLLQLRGVEPAKIAKALEALFNTNGQVVGSIVDIVELRNGADILLLDRGSASKILRELRKRFRVRTKTTGEDVGVTSTGSMRRRQVISALLYERRRA